MSSGDLKRYKYFKISKSVFFTITIIFLHSIWWESKNKNKCRPAYKLIHAQNVAKLYENWDECQLEITWMINCFKKILIKIHTIVQLNWTLLNPYAPLEIKKITPCHLYLTMFQYILSYKGQNISDHLLYYKKRIFENNV